jgi:hypothetical protein
MTCLFNCFYENERVSLDILLSIKLNQINFIALLNLSVNFKIMLIWNLKVSVKCQLLVMYKNSFLNEII